MRIISLTNGEMEFIKYDDDIIDLVNEHMGYDMSRVVKALADRANEVKYNTESDLLSYELSLEESREGYLELSDILETMTNILGKSKINKVLIFDLIDKMEYVINKNI